MSNLGDLNQVDVARLFGGTPSLDNLYDALCKPDYTVDIGGVKVGVKGQYFKGAGIGYSRTGEPIDPPEPSSFDIDEVFIGGVPCMGMFGEAGTDLLEYIEQKVCERIEL